MKHFMKHAFFLLFIHFKWFFFLDLSNLMPGTMQSENVSYDEINDGEIDISVMFNLTTVISEFHKTNSL